MRSRIVYALNPNAGLGTPIEATESPDIDVVTGASFDDLKTLTRAAIDPDTRALIVQGGDGMASLGASLVAGTEVPLGVVPTGTGNDFARGVRLPRGEARVVRSKLLGALQRSDTKTRRVDLLRYRLDDRDGVAVNSINIGFDARVNERANELRKLPGTFRYLVALAQVVQRFEPAELRVAIDADAPTRVETQLLSIQNGPTIGGGIRTIPQAKPDDGLLEALHVSQLGKMGLLALFPLAAFGLHRRLEPAKFVQGHRLQAVIPAGIPIYADGECLRPSGWEGEPARIEVTIDPGALRLIRA